jgi:hypothetical protein
VVRVEDGAIGQVDTLASLGVKVEVRRGKPARWEHSSSEGVSIKVKADGKAEAGVAAALDGGVEVTFERRHAIYFRAEEAVVESIEDKSALGAEILERFRAGLWRDTDAVVTEVVRSRSTTVLIAGAAGARAELRGAVDAGAQAGGQATLLMSSHSGLHTHIVAMAQLTPLFRAWGIRRKLFGATAGNVVMRDAADADASWAELGLTAR